MSAWTHTYPKRHSNKVCKKDIHACTHRAIDRQPDRQVNNETHSNRERRERRVTHRDGAMESTLPVSLCMYVT